MNPPGGKPFTSQGVVRSLENAVRLATLTAPLLRGLTSSLMGSGVSGGKQATQKRIATSRSQTEKKPSPPIIKVKSAPTSFSSSSAKPQGTLSNGKCGRAQLCEQGSYIPSERHYYRQIIGTCVTNASSVLCLNLTGTDVTYGVPDSFVRRSAHHHPDGTRRQNSSLLRESRCEVEVCADCEYINRWSPCVCRL